MLGSKELAMDKEDPSRSKHMLLNRRQHLVVIRQREEGIIKVLKEDNHNKVVANNSEDQNNVHKVVLTLNKVHNNKKVLNHNINKGHNTKKVLTLNKVLTLISKVLKQGIIKVHKEGNHNRVVANNSEDQNNIYKVVLTLNKVHNNKKILNHNINNKVLRIMKANKNNKGPYHNKENLNSNHNNSSSDLKKQLVMQVPIQWYLVKCKKDLEN